jgi:hypothetical protein
MAIKEGEYQNRIIKKLEFRFPGCIILKTDSGYQQGIPDLIFLWREFWAVLEVKTSAAAALQPNQNYYIERLDKMSFAAYIYPENEEEVFIALQQAFEPPRRARVS